MNYLHQDLTYKLRGIFFEIYNKLGPGFAENIYHKAIIQDLENKNISYETEKIISIKYKDKKVGQQKLDLVVDNKIIIEIKATDNMHSLFIKQTLAYLKASDYKLTLLVNFGSDKLAIKRYIK